MREETSSGGETARGSAKPAPSNNNNTIAAEEEFVGPEFEEDAYFGGLAATPSFDDLDEASDSEEILVHWHHQSGEIIEEIEAIDFKDEDASGERRSLRRDLRARIRAKLMRMVKSGEDAALHRSGSLSPSIDGSVVSELQGLTPEEQERQKAEWQAELARIEDEIQTLREVLNSKVRAAHELKRKLGISVWRELSSDVNQGFKNVKESQVYQNVGEKLGQFTRTVSENSLFQKTESVIKTTAEKTTSILGGFGSGLSMKIGQMRNSDSFRSLEEKMGSAYENVKGRMTPSRSNSTQSFDEALREAGASRRASAAPSVTSPTIPEDKMLS